MSSPEQLTRRVGRTEEDVRAVADTVIEIRDTQLEHGRKLDTIEDRLGALETQFTEGFAEILRRRLHLHRPTCHTSAPFRVRAPGPVSGQLYGRPPAEEPV